MPADKTQFKEMVERKLKKEQENPTRTATQHFTSELLKRESVRCGALVGSSEWDSYLGYIESILANHKDLKKQAISGLENPKIVDYTHLIQIKMFLRETCAVIEVLEQLIKLPYAIIHENASVNEVASRIPLPEPPDFLNEKT